MCRILKEALVSPSQLVDETIKLSILDQHAVRIYSKFVLIFKTEPGHGVTSTVEHLEEGLAAALSQHHEFAATVVPKPGSARNELELDVQSESGVPFRIVDHSLGADDGQDCCELKQAGSYEELDKNKFALTKMSDGIFFIPNANPEDDLAAGIPALLVQVNIIEGGVLVGVTWHHTVSDARGVNNFLMTWAKATSSSCLYGDAESQDFTGEEMLLRWRLSCGTRGATIADFPEYVPDASWRAPNTGQPHLLDRAFIAPPGQDISMWYFSKESLLSLVNLVNNSSAQNTEQYLPVEALSALLWKHFSLSRELNVSHPEGTSLFTTRVDYRRRVLPPLPHSYIGNANQPVPRIRVPVREVCTPPTGDSLASLASYIRRAVTVNDDKVVRQLIGYVESLPAVTDLALKFDTFPGPDIAITDLSGLDVMRHSWGSCLGKVNHVRGFVRYRGFVAFMPQDREGGISAYLQCDTKALERLKADGRFTQYGTFLY